MPTFVVLTKQPSLTKQNRGWQADWKNDSVKSSRVWWTRLVSTPRRRDVRRPIVQADRGGQKERRTRISAIRIAITTGSGFLAFEALHVDDSQNVRDS